MPTPASTLRDHAPAVADLGGTADAFAALDSAELTDATRSIATLRRAVDQFAALAAAEVARRSRHELGHQGLAQRAGFLNPIAMIQSVAHVGRQEAARMVEAGALLADAHFAARADEEVGDGVGGEGTGVEGTDEQISADAFAGMIRLAADADPGTLVGSRRPAVRVIVTADRLKKREGPWHIEGRIDAVSMPTIERQICDTGVIAIEFDRDGQCMNVGREKRLFTQRQRIGLAIRDGECLFPGFDRPPSYCEAHHIDPWVAAGGKTDLADGVLLCRRHHLLIRYNRWQVIREGARYLLRPPPDIARTRN